MYKSIALASIEKESITREVTRQKLFCFRDRFSFAPYEWYLGVGHENDIFFFTDISVTDITIISERYSDKQISYIFLIPIKRRCCIHWCYYYYLCLCFLLIHAKHTYMRYNDHWIVDFHVFFRFLYYEVAASSIFFSNGAKRSRVRYSDRGSITFEVFLVIILLWNWCQFFFFMSAKKIIHALLCSGHYRISCMFLDPHAGRFLHQMNFFNLYRSLGSWDIFIKGEINAKAFDPCPLKQRPKTK